MTARPPGMHDVARMAGVSHQTVSRVLNDHPSVRPETRERVQAAIAELGYRRNPIARALVTRRTHTIGVLAPASNLFGPAAGLPAAISGVNSHWARGYGDPPPRTLIVLGFRHEAAERRFETCGLAARLANRYGVLNEETRDHPDVFVCRGPRQPWPAVWPELRRFG